MEGVGMNFWRGRRVVVTGHTGFKGSWLSLWLQQLGAELCGIALPSSTRPSLFEEARISQGMLSCIADIRDLDRVCAIFREFNPEIVFHMAAQPLVRTSYEDPVGTYATNVMGTVNVLDAVRRSESIRAVVVITTDKCYENKEWEWPYRETDRLGGYDPYSNSKACAELVVSAYRDSFFPPNQFDKHGVAIATARAGNVIGGGDWAKDRLIPDIMRAFASGIPVKIRSPHAIRPWQHVLEPLSGYLKLGESLCAEGVKCGGAWNFGPEQADMQTVGGIVQDLASIWGEEAIWELEEAPQPHEAQCLKLDWSKAQHRLGWRPRLTLKEALAMTAGWYRAREQKQNTRALTTAQIEHYLQLKPIDAENYSGMDRLPACTSTI
jgi:CDP-glucose 4,6-dehydratase